MPFSLKRYSNERTGRDALQPAQQEPETTQPGPLLQESAEPRRAHEAVHGIGNKGSINELRALAWQKETVRLADCTLKFGRYVVNRMEQGYESRGEFSGIWYAGMYARNYPNNWNPDFDKGFAAPDLLDRLAPMDWRLRENQSASQAVKAWLNGPTIAECASSIVAFHLDALRQKLGDARFDACFGSEDGSQPRLMRLRINGNHADCLPAQLLKGAGVDERTGGPLLVIGAKYHFRNDENYNFRHPDGYAQGENVIHTGRNDEGEALWLGFATKELTTTELFEMLAQTYEFERTEGDYEKILFHETTRVEPEWVTRTHADGFDYKSIYELCVKKETIHPAFVQAETIDTGGGSHQRSRPAGVEGQGIMFDMGQIERLPQKP